MVGWRSRTGWRSRAALGVAALVLTGACGGATDVGSGTSDTATGVAASVDEAGMVPWCDDVPRPGPVRDSDQLGGGPDSALMAVVTRYGAEHADTFAGLWLDRAHGGTVVIAFTDDPVAHRAAIDALTAQPGDASGSHMEPSTTVFASVGGPIDGPVTVTSTTTTAPPSTTVAQSGVAYDVVQVANSEADLQAVADGLDGPLHDDPDIRVSMRYPDPALNRVKLSLVGADDDARRHLAGLVPVGTTCVNGPPTVTERPDTMIPPVGSDPLVLCSGAGPFRASVLDDPPVLAADDPLWVAFQEQKDVFPVQQPGTEVEWILLDRTERAAVFGAGRPPSAILYLALEGDRWVATGSSGMAMGEGCHPQALLPEGLEPVEWMLDPTLPPPGPADTVVHLRVYETCAGEGPLDGRLVPPEVVERDGQVLVALAVRAPEEQADGSFDDLSCAIADPISVPITLPSPLGSRVIADGTFVPPVPAET